MRKMLRFEIKKIFSRTRNRVAVAFLLVVLVVVSMLTINMVEYTDENGESSTGIAAARELSLIHIWCIYLPILSPTI